MDNACVATVLAATWITQGNNSPAILYILGIISNNPCEAVNVDVQGTCLQRSAVTVPAAPPSLCNSTILGTLFQIFFLPLELIQFGMAPHRLKMA